MLPIRPTAQAVSDAILHYRQIRELNRDDLAYVLMMHGHHVTADAISKMEKGERAITVDDLMAFAVALDVAPATLLSHIPIDMPTPEGPFGTGLPADIERPEMQAWIQGQTALDRDSRIVWWGREVARRRIRFAHCEEQLQGAYAEKRDLGELVKQEEESPTIQRLYDRILDGEDAFRQSELALALAEEQLERLKEGE